MLSSQQFKESTEMKLFKRILIDIAALLLALVIVVLCIWKNEIITLMGMN